METAERGLVIAASGRDDGASAWRIGQRTTHQDYGMVETGKNLHVRCVDNTLQRHTLAVGRVYEVTQDLERDGYYELSGLGRFSRSRFEVVQANNDDDDTDTPRASQ
jgi:hypothetical protein